MSGTLHVLDARTITEPSSADEVLAYYFMWAEDGDVLTLHSQWCRTQIHVAENVSRCDDDRRSQGMSATVCAPSPCIECSKPARLAIGIDDLYAAHCSNECALATWNRERLASVGSLTVARIDHVLSTTGIDLS